MRTPIITTLTFAALMAAAAATPAAAIETINCQVDHNLAERTICASRSLQTLDARVTEAYADIMLDSHITGHVKRAVHASQLEFLSRRDSCGSDAECLIELMERRATRINFYR